MKLRKAKSGRLSARLQPERLSNGMTFIFSEVLATVISPLFYPSGNDTFIIAFAQNTNSDCTVIALGIAPFFYISYKKLF
jgi:hypothetical protein